MAARVGELAQGGIEYVCTSQARFEGLFCISRHCIALHCITISFPTYPAVLDLRRLRKWGTFTLLEFVFYLLVVISGSVCVIPRNRRVGFIMQPKHSPSHPDVFLHNQITHHESA